VDRRGGRMKATKDRDRKRIKEQASHGSAPHGDDKNDTTN
jgi:hypothetical protein